MIRSVVMSRSLCIVMIVKIYSVEWGHGVETSHLTLTMKLFVFLISLYCWTGNHGNIVCARADLLSLNLYCTPG